MAKQNSGNSFSVFILDDDDWYRDLLGHVAGLNAEYTVKKFSRGKRPDKSVA